MALMLVDSASMYFRAFHALPSSMTSPDGVPVNAVRGFLDLLARLVDQWTPDSLCCCWDDDWRPAWRVDRVPTYKSHRVVEESDSEELVPDELGPQVEIIIDLLAAFGIARIGAEHHEADDVIATLAQASGRGVDIVSGDRDLFQLIDDSRGIRVLYPGKKGAWDVVTDAVVSERYGVTSAQYADLALLRGDPSDGLPGVKGVGEKTAAALLTAYGDAAAIERAARDPQSTMTPRVRASVIDAADYLEAARPVVMAVRDLPLPDTDLRIPSEPADPDRWESLLTRWGVTTSGRRLEAACRALSAS